MSRSKYTGCSCWMCRRRKHCNGRLRHQDEVQLQDDVADLAHEGGVGNVHGDVENATDLPEEPDDGEVP